MRLARVILAGGTSRQAGGANKAEVMLAGQSLLSWVSERFVPQVEIAAISSGQRTELPQTCGLPMLPDTLPGGLGPLAGVLAGLDWAAGQSADFLVTVAVDAPFLPCDLAPQLLLAAELNECRAAIAASRDETDTLRTHATFGLWPIECRADLEQALKNGQCRMMDWAEAQGAARAEFPVIGGMDPFLNINRPKDLAQAERWLSEMSALASRSRQAGQDGASSLNAD